MDYNFTRWVQKMLASSWILPCDCLQTPSLVVRLHSVRGGWRGWCSSHSFHYFELFISVLPQNDSCCPFPLDCCTRQDALVTLTNSSEHRWLTSDAHFTLTCVLLMPSSSSLVTSACRSNSVCATRSSCSACRGKWKDKKWWMGFYKHQ